MEIHINLKADIVKVDPATGVVTLAIEARPMPNDLVRMLDTYFPHCQGEIGEMTAKEAVISSILPS